MGTLYLIDGHNPTLANSAIKDTFILPSGQREIRGVFPVILPFEVPMAGTPTTVTDLVTQKFAGLLSIYPGYTHILYDEQLDATGWDTTTTNGLGTCYTVGSRKTTKLVSSDGSSLVSNATSLLATPTNCVVRFELFSYQDTDTTSGQYTRFYSETTDVATGMTVEVSFTGGTNWNAVTNGIPLSIPSPSQGSSFRIRFHKTVAGPVWIGSWALIY